MKIPRRSVSIRQETYDRLYAHAKQAGRSSSDIVEEYVAKLTGAEWPPQGARKGPRKPGGGRKRAKPRERAVPVLADESLELTPPRLIADKRPNTRRPPSSDPIGKVRRLEIPEGHNVKEARPAPRPVKIEKRPVGWGF